MRGAIWAVLALPFLAGCDTYAASRYAISADNVVALRQFSGRTATVGAFTAGTPGQSEMVCRAVGPIKTPDGEPFSEYVRKALIDEMRIAGIYDPASPVSITGRLEQIELSSVSGSWRLALTASTSSGASFAVTEVYSFTSSFAAVTACREAANALMPAVQNLVGRIVRNPEFARMIRG